MGLPINPNYFPWRSGQRRARKIVAKYFQLQPGHVVHHVDSDNRNNELSNLAVFGSHAEHIAHHHGSPVVPLWQGKHMDGVIDAEAHRCEFIHRVCKHCGSRLLLRSLIHLSAPISPPQPNHTPLQDFVRESEK